MTTFPNVHPKVGGDIGAAWVFPWAALVAALALVPVSTSYAQPSALVKVTPLGSHAGELCFRDRAILFEDPTGARILYDPGFTVDEVDPRLGDVDVILLSHAHNDHIGNSRPGAGGTCAAPAVGVANANSNVATIAATRNAVVVAPDELATFMTRKMQNVRGAAPPACAAVGLANETVVPQPSPCIAVLRPGGSRMFRRGSAASAVQIAVVPAVHPNGIDGTLIDTPGLPPGIVGYGGQAAGFIVRFTNGLTTYLTGDTGMFGDMEHVIARYYRPNLVVINISDINVTGPDEAAFVIQHLLRPTTVVASHTNEQSTADGVVRGGTRIDRFARQVRGFADVVVPLSNVVRMFDGEGRCIGCR